MPAFFSIALTVFLIKVIVLVYLTPFLLKLSSAVPFTAYVY